MNTTNQFCRTGFTEFLEDITNQGRININIRFNGHGYLFEYKVVEQVPTGKALQ